MQPFQTRPSPRLVYGAGSLAELPGCVRSLGASSVLLVTDAGVAGVGHAARAAGLLEEAGVAVTVYDGCRENPTEADVEACRAVAEQVRPEALVGLGGGSSMDTAKGCNFLLNNGGRMEDYRGYGLATGAMLPLVAVPTTAGTGSECQSYAVIARDGDHEKMACGDPKALARVAILDPELTVSQPPAVAVLSALDALSHALESAVCSRRNPLSGALAGEAFRLISGAIRPVIGGGAGLGERGEMLLGAAFAGAAVENSMLGAAHAAANPLTAELGLAHGHAVALMLPQVVRFNLADARAAVVYGELEAVLGEPLLPWLEAMIRAAGLAVPALDPVSIPRLAAAAARQWTGQFNPRPVTGEDFRVFYQNLAREAIVAVP